MNISVSVIVACMRACVRSYVRVKAYPTESSCISRNGRKNRKNVVAHPPFGIVFILDRVTMKNETQNKPCNYESEKSDIGYRERVGKRELMQHQNTESSVKL